jgi:hypothetical protein
MRYSPEALIAFVETVSAGSFSAAARRLRKASPLSVPQLRIWKLIWGLSCLTARRASQS